MVQMSAADNVQSARYDLLDTLGEYARERRELAGEADSVRASHVAWHLEAAEHVDDELWRTEQEWWAEWLEKEHGNFVQWWWSSPASPLMAHDSLPAAGQALPDGIGYPLGSSQGFSDLFLTSHPPLPSFPGALESAVSSLRVPC